MLHCTVRRLKTQHPHAPAAAPGARAVPARGGAPAPPAGAPAADRAAALWQLCCRIGTTTTIACQVVDSRARCHRVQMATVVERGANAGTARRARDGRRAYPANRHRVCIRTRSCVRRLTISIAVGAAFGYDTRAHVSVEHSRGARPHSAPFALRRTRRDLVPRARELVSLAGVLV